MCTSADETRSGLLTWACSSTSTADGPNSFHVCWARKHSASEQSNRMIKTTVQTSRSVAGLFTQRSGKANVWRMPKVFVRRKFSTNKSHNQSTSAYSDLQMKVTMPKPLQLPKDLCIFFLEWGPSLHNPTDLSGGYSSATSTSLASHVLASANLLDGAIVWEVWWDVSCECQLGRSGVIITLFCMRSPPR